MSRKRKVPQKYLDGDTESGGNALIQGKEIALGERIFQLDDDQSQLDVPFDKHGDLINCFTILGSQRKLCFLTPLLSV